MAALRHKLPLAASKSNFRFPPESRLNAEFAACPKSARTGRSLIRHYGLGALQLYADDRVMSCCNCMGRSRITGATRQ